MTRLLQKITVWLLAVTAMILANETAGATLPPVVRGGRAVLLRPDPGPLTIRIHKRDLNIYEGPDELVAHLYDPQRRLIATLTIPDDGSTGKTGRSEKLQSGEINTACPIPGVYRLIIVNGGDLVFGLETSCPRYVVEGDMTLNDGSLAGRTFFQPPLGAFNVTAQALHNPGIQKLPLLDAKGNVMYTFDLAKAGADQVYQVPANAGAREGLWSFDIAKMDVKLQVQGATYWTADASAYFPAEKTRWMLLPYCETRYLKPGCSAEIGYTLRNRTGRKARFVLKTQADPAIECKVVDPASPMELKKDEVRTVRVVVRMGNEAKDGGTFNGYLTAAAVDDPEVTQSAGIEVRRGESPVSRELKLPIVLQRYRHENAQFGYAPDYVANEVYFDLRNRPFIRERTESAYRTTALTLLDEGRWVERPFVATLEKAYPGYRGIYFGGGFLGAKIAFDGDNAAYTLLSVITADRHRQTVLLYTPDDGRNYTVHELPGGAFDIEQFTGHNALTAPPPVLAYRWTAARPERFASVNDLLLFLPKKEGGKPRTNPMALGEPKELKERLVRGKLLLGDPVLVSQRCLGSCQHSGGPASTATRDGKTHIVWGEVTDEGVPGVPTYVATYDHALGKLGEKVFLAYGPPINDVHNVPAICQDSAGYIHVLTGAHGLPFKYTRSLKPNDAYSGWTQPVEVLSAGYVDDKSKAGGEGRQTYISLVCDPQDALHIAFRQWRRKVDDYHSGQNYAALSVQSKPKDQPWGPARPLVIPPVTGYSIYYHKLTIDRRGRLYLSYSYWTNDESYQNDFPDRYHHRAVLVSKDAGKSWKLAETRDFGGE